MDATQRDQALIAAGEPPWGDVEPGTTSVTYWLALPSPNQHLLFRIVAAEHHGPFYYQRHAGNGTWVDDARGFTYVGHAPDQQPKYLELTGRQAAEVMRIEDA